MYEEPCKPNQDAHSTTFGHVIGFPCRSKAESINPRRGGRQCNRLKIGSKRSAWPNTQLSLEDETYGQC